MTDQTEKARRRSVQRRRSAAKAGMLGALGALVLTGMSRGRGAGPLHVWAGVALLGFTYWHSRLYGATCKADRR